MFGAMGGSSAGDDAAAVTIRNAISLLAAVSDPAAAKKLLDELAAGLNEMKAREAEVKRQEAANTEKLKGLLATEREQQKQQARLDGISGNLSAHQTRIDVAASALAEREKALQTREAAASALEHKLAKDTQALAARLESYRNALG